MFKNSKNCFLFSDENRKNESTERRSTAEPMGVHCISYSCTTVCNHELPGLTDWKKKAFWTCWRDCCRQKSIGERNRKKKKLLEGRVPLNLYFIEKRNKTRMEKITVYPPSWCSFFFLFLKNSKCFSATPLLHNTYRENRWLSSMCVRI